MHFSSPRIRESHGGIASGTAALIVATLVVLPLLVAGCAKKPLTDDTVIATVGDRDVTAGYYKEKLAKLQLDQLPRDDAGQPVDTSTLAGKKAFLDVLVNKELMVLKGYQLGYMNDPQVASNFATLKDYQAQNVYWEDQLKDVPAIAPEADVQHYFSRLGEKRNIDFIIADYEADAEKARADALAGVPWDTIKARYHAKDADATRPTNLTVAWGQYSPDFEAAVFGEDVGGVTHPIPSQYGYWVVRVDSIMADAKPDLASIHDRVAQQLGSRNRTLAQEAKRAELRQAHDLVIDPDALAVCFAGLPLKEDIIDPDTKKPTKHDDLKPLNVDPKDFDLPLVSYKLSTGPVLVTVGDYKDMFDQMNVFDRPKRGELIGNMERKLQIDADKAILHDVAVTSGYLDDPRTVARATERIEQMFVEKVHNEQVPFEQYVSPEQIQSFWDEHKEDYFVTETRFGRMVRCADEAAAAKARQAVLDGQSWRDVNKLFGNDAKLLDEFGRLHAIHEDDDHVGAKFLFTLPLNELSQPTEIDGGWAVGICEKVEDAFQPKLEDRKDLVVKRIQAERQDQSLVESLAKWRQEFPVTVDEKALAELPSYQTLAAANPQPAQAS